MNQQQPALVEQSLQATLEKATQLEQLLSKLNHIKADKLQENTNSSQYLDLLASILYCLNSVTHSYAHLKSEAVPEEFNTVKTYYQKIKDAIQNKNTDGPTTKINKEAVGRIIKRNT